MGPFISFLSDYGLDDGFVGVCHGVMAGICPQARIVDLTHGVPRHDVRAGAILLEGALAFLPVGVHLAVVDPGVGSERRGVVLRCGDGRLLVGPDNGLLALAGAACGGVVEAVDLAGSPLALPHVSPTFHGRDVFAPVAAHLAAGAAPARAGTPVDPASLTGLRLAPPWADAGGLSAIVRYVDGFGNLQLNARPEDLSPTGLSIGDVAAVSLPDDTEHEASYASVFADGEPGELILYADGAGRLALALNQDSAADRLGLEADARVRIAPAGS